MRRRNRRRVRDDVHLIVYANATACRSCAFKPRCTNAASRDVTRYENEAVLERMADRLAARPEVLDRRRESVEHPFGSIKQWMGHSAFLMRRLDNVRAEFSLTALAYNLRRAITLIGIPALIAAVSARRAAYYPKIRPKMASQNAQKHYYRPERARHRTLSPENNGCHAKRLYARPQMGFHIVWTALYHGQVDDHAPISAFRNYVNGPGCLAGPNAAQNPGIKTIERLKALFSNNTVINKKCR